MVRTRRTRRRSAPFATLPVGVGMRWRTAAVWPAYSGQGDRAFRRRGTSICLPASAGRVRAARDLNEHGTRVAATITGNLGVPGAGVGVTAELAAVVGSGDRREL